MNEDAPFYTSKLFITFAIITFLVVYRKFGGYYFRSTMALLTLVVIATYGLIVAPIFNLIGKVGLLNWSVAHGYYHLGGFFWGVKVIPEGTENFDKVKGPAIYVCNHQSSMDIMLMGSVYPKNTSVVAKKAIKYYPFIVSLSHAIFLDRANRDNAVKLAKKTAEDIHKKQTGVWVFPEGTRGHETKPSLLPFKKGAFYMAVQAQVPIVPVVMENYNHLYNGKAKRFLPGTVRCRILPPIPTEGIKETSEEITKLTELCREQMLAAVIDISSKKSQ